MQHSTANISVRFDFGRFQFWWGIDDADQVMIRHTSISCLFDCSFWVVCLFWHSRHHCCLVPEISVSCLFASFLKRTIQKRQNCPWICLWYLEALFASSENPYTCQSTNCCLIPTVLSCRKPIMTKIGDTHQSFSVQHLAQSIDIKKSKSRHIQNCAVVDDDRLLSNCRHVMT